jgi:gas vesicle protein
MNKSAKKFAVGTMIAAAAGYLAGILTAPKSGKETREDIKEAAERSVSEAERRLKKLHTELNTVISEATSRLEELNGKAHAELKKVMDSSQTTKEKAREILSAVHEGHADDKDLKKAIAEAEKAVDYLKRYLTKQ